MRELKRRKQTVYAFARSVNDVHPMTIQEWLYSGRRVSVDIADKALKVLGLMVVRRRRTKRKKEKVQNERN